MRITVLGGTGYTGGAIAREAAARGHTVTAFSRSVPPTTPDGVESVAADATADEVLDRAVATDVVVAALAPRGALAGALAPLYARLAELAARSGARLIVIGGWSGLRPSDGAPRFSEGDVDPRFADEVHEMVRVLDALTASDQGLDWLFVSPAQVYGSYAPQPVTGAYRLGGEVALTSPDGPTTLSAEDFATAIVDLAEGDRWRQHVAVAA